MKILAICRSAFALGVFGFLLAAPALADPGDALDTGGGGIARAYVVHALHTLDHEDSTRALALTDRALSLYPNFMRARFTHGLAMLTSGQYDGAAADFTAVIAAHRNIRASSSCVA